MIKLYDTRRRQKVDFEPVEPGKVSMYVCGPTVYSLFMNFLRKFY